MLVFGYASMMVANFPTKDGLKERQIHHDGTIQIAIVPGNYYPCQFISAFSGVP